MEGSWEIGNGNGRTLAEHERVVDFLSILYVSYQTKNSVELAGRERVGGGELWIEEAENLNQKSQMMTKESAIDCTE